MGLGALIYCVASGAGSAGVCGGGVGLGADFAKSGKDAFGGSVSERLPIDAMCRRVNCEVGAESTINDEYDHEMMLRGNSKESGVRP